MKPFGEGYDQIEKSLHQEMITRNFFFHLFIIAYELIMMVSISLRPGGPFAKPRRTAYFLMYVLLILATAGTMALQSRVNKKENGHRFYFRTENAYMIFFSLWGVAVTLTDQLGGNGLTVYTYTSLILAILSQMKPWKTGALIFLNFALLNLLLPYFPDPNGLDNTYNNLMNSAFLSLASIIITTNFYNSRIRVKTDELIIKNQYRQIETMNGMLREEALTDALTGLRNRNSFHKATDLLSHTAGGSLACIYIDVNGLHEINNCLGHQAGDEMLKTVSDILLEQFSPEEVFRIGGDEFVVLCKDMSCGNPAERIDKVVRQVEEMGYSLSIGYEWREENLDIHEIIQKAESSMQKNKRQYYDARGNERQTRNLNMQMERLLSEKKDAERFLSVLAPVFKGVYFVNLENDTLRQLFIPDYFKEMLEECGERYSQALMLYAHRMVRSEYLPLFEKFCSYGQLKRLLKEDGIPAFTYEKKDGMKLKLQILNFNHYYGGYKETLWVFSDLDAEEVL